MTLLGELVEQEARHRALDLAGPLGIHEQSAAFEVLVRELIDAYTYREALRRIEELTLGRLHLGPTTLGRLRAILDQVPDP